MLRKEFIGLSFLSLLSLLSKKVFGDIIKYKRVYKKVIVCPDTVNAPVNLDFNPYYIGWWAELTSSLPTGVTDITLISTGSLIALEFGSVPVGSYEIEITVREQTSSGNVVGVFVVEVNSVSSCATSETPCCSTEQILVAWLNTAGGLSTFTFSGVYQLDMRVGDALTFKSKDSNGVYSKQYSQRKDIYNAYRLTTGSVTRAQIEYLSTLKTSIQAWYVVGSDIVPILVDNESFSIYKSTDKIFDFSFQFIVPETQVQTQ